MGHARRSGQGSWAGQGGGVPAFDPGRGGVSMYIGPPHIWDTQNGLFVKRKIDNTVALIVNQLPI